MPESRGEVVRCILESLALAYADAAREACELTGKSVDRLHVVGGGSRNALLNELTASALGLPVIAGPAEGAAMGNILVQAMATGEVGSIRELRAIVRASVETVVHEPAASGRWDEKRADLRRIEAPA